jgi:hypothetical protein
MCANDLRLVGRVPRARLAAELRAVLSNPRVVPDHLEGLRHGTELLDHAFPELGAEFSLRDAERHGVLPVTAV